MSLVETLQQMLEKAKENYQSAAASHAMTRVGHYGGRIEALENVLKLITGRIT